MFLFLPYSLSKKQWKKKCPWVRITNNFKKCSQGNKSLSKRDGTNIIDLWLSIIPQHVLSEMCPLSPLLKNKGLKY